MNKKENRGGERLHSGRKKLPAGDKKIQICRYFKEKDIKELGGKVAVNQLIDNYIEKILKKNLQNQK